VNAAPLSANNPRGTPHWRTGRFSSFTTSPTLSRCPTSIAKPSRLQASIAVKVREPPLVPSWSWMKSRLQA
jgi:hypothetical protein